MPQKTFFDIVIDVAPFVTVAGLCGVYASVRRGWHGWGELTLSMVGSGICGGIVGWAMMGVDASPYLVGAMCGVAGLLGDRGLRAMQKALLKRIDKEIGGGQ